MKFILAKDIPKKEKIISSHLVNGTISKCALKSSILSKETTEDVQPTSNFANPLSTNEWNNEIDALERKKKKMK